MVSWAVLRLLALFRVTESSKTYDLPPIGVLAVIVRLSKWVDSCLRRLGSKLPLGVLMPLPSFFIFKMLPI